MQSLTTASRLRIIISHKILVVDQDCSVPSDTILQDYQVATKIDKNEIFPAMSDVSA